MDNTENVTELTLDQLVQYLCQLREGVIVKVTFEEGRLSEN